MCNDLDVARSQFEGIFVKRSYAFKCGAKNPVIIDCGGNVGLSAIWFKQNYPDCDLTVYEADSAIAKILVSNLASAGYSHTRVLNEAVWVEDGEIGFVATGLDTGHIDSGGAAKVRTVDLGKSLPQHVDLLKIDIEGAEFPVLERMIESGAIARVDHLVVEFHPSRDTFPRMLQIFEKLEHAGMRVSFESILGPWMGVDTEGSPFGVVDRNRMFVEAYIWRFGLGAS